MVFKRHNVKIYMFEGMFQVLVTITGKITVKFGFMEKCHSASYNYYGMNRIWRYYDFMEKHTCHTAQ